MKRYIFLAGLVWLIASAAVSAPVTTQPSAEAKLIADLYGKRIAKVRASADKADDVTLSREILLAAADSVNPTALRHLLAMEALKLSSNVGSEEAAKLASEALTLADKLKPLPPIEKCRLKVRIAEQRHDFARRNRVSVKDRVPLAEDMVDAEIALAKALIQVKQIRQADTVLAAAHSKAAKYKLLEHQSDIKAIMKALQALDARLRQIRILEARLKRALKENDAETVKASRRNLALIYLLGNGDIPRANSYLAGTGHQYESSVSVAAAFLKNPKKIPTPDACNDAIKNLITAAKSAHCADARDRIATVAAKLCRALQAGKLTGLTAAKTRLLLVEAEKLLEIGAADRFIRKLKKNHGGLAGKIEVLNLKEKLVRVTYDFSRRKQLGDWRILRGSWSVVRSKEAVVATPKRNGWVARAAMSNRLCFRADKPFRFTFRARGRESLVGVMSFQPGNNPHQSSHRLDLRLGERDNSRSCLYDGGGWRVWSSDSIRIDRNTTYRIEMAWDGQKTLTCTANGKVLCKHNINYPKEKLSYTSLVVRLGTRNHPAGFDDVTLEGVIIEDPNHRFKIPKRRW